MQLNNAMARLHDSANKDGPRHMIRTPSGKMISKATAVIMLKELFLTGGRELSKDRLKRIEQCASSSQKINQQLVEHNGSHLELFQDVCIAFDDGPGTNVRAEFGRIQKIVSRVGKRSHLMLSAVPLNNIPVGLELRFKFYTRIGQSLTFKYSSKPDLNRYPAKSVIMIVAFEYDQKNDTYILSENQWEEINSELRKVQHDINSARRFSQRTSQKRKQRHKREALAIKNDHRSRYRSDARSMRRSRRQRSEKRMGTVTNTSTSKNDTALQVGMKVRLYHEVSHNPTHTHATCSINVPKFSHTCIHN